VLLDLDMLSASIEIIYSVQVVLRFLFADKRNLPFSISTADPEKKGESTIAFQIEEMLAEMMERQRQNRGPECRLDASRYLPKYQSS